MALFREEEAQNRDMPRGHIIKDDEILRIASNKPKNHIDLNNLRLISKSTKIGWIANGIMNALKNSDQVPIEHINEHQYIPLSAEQEALIDLLRLLLKLKSIKKLLRISLILR